MKTRSLLIRVIISSFLLLFAVGNLNAQVYCTPQFLLGCSLGGIPADDINTFILPGENGTFISDNNTGCGTGGYDDRTAEIVKLTQGNTYTISINSQVQFSNLEIFIDYDANGAFDATEIIGGGNNIAMAPALTNISFTVPVTLGSGTYRLRAMVSGDNNYPDIAPCGDLFYISGEAHDYSLIVGSSCVNVTNLAVSGIGATSATATWDAQTGVQGYEYTVDQSPFDPASGTPVSSSTAALTGLTASTSYYLHVRADCDASHTSEWVSIPFTTTAGSSGACNSVTNIVTMGNGDSSVQISWDAVGGAVGYEYLIDQSLFDPTVPGVAVSSNVINLTTLPPGINYVHVRTDCGGGNFSTWAVQPIAILLGVNNVQGSNFDLNVFPNPAKDKISVQAAGKQAGAALIQLTDITGKVLQTVAVNGSNTVLDVHTMPAGVYMIRYADDVNRKTVKITKQ